ncbi:unnamed protein product [marine sediment metagenome]|uniref:Uncharacterized protein n=1 Tax=marine sediment metagenome TaxID=412755 RepID=X1BIY3_9ZZZZ
MPAIEKGREYKDVKCDKCHKSYKEHSMYTVDTKKYAKDAGMEVGQNICIGCSLDVGDEEFEEEMAKLDAKMEKENQEALEIGRKRAADPAWKEKLQSRMMEAMTKHLERK